MNFIIRPSEGAVGVTIMSKEASSVGIGVFKEVEFLKV